MSIPKNITRQDLLKALQEIKESGIPKNAHSTMYDVIWKGNRYPPKLLVSLANKYANGKEINRLDFKGGEGTQAFALIQNHGFSIERKTQNRMNFTENIPAYYCVGFHYYSQSNTSQLDRFIRNGIWENGYSDKFTKKTNSVPVGSAIAAKTSYTMKRDGKTIPVLEVHARGIVTGNRKNGKVLDVDWEENFIPVKLEGQGGYRNTISRAWNSRAIERIFKQNQNETLDIDSEIYDHALNLILYGPPGTGKTYQTKKRAIDIVNPSFKYDEDNFDTYRKQLNKEYQRLVKEKQIVFTTFHQSMGYEDFVEGIKPDPNNDGEISYSVQSGIFKRLCESYEGNVKTIEEAIENFISKIDTEGEQVLETTRGSEFIVNYSGGTTFKITPKNSARENPEYPASIEYIKKMFLGKDLTGLYNPSYVKSILKYLKTQYKLREAKNEYVSNKKYVLIIDEINRGNISAIFGELITLLEPDKRRSGKEALEVTLPYSKDSFSIPSNVYIIGTMNTADRSIESLDTALRRRFVFEEIMPQPELISPDAAFYNLLWDYRKDDWENSIYKEKEKELLEFTGAEDRLMEERKRIWEDMKEDGFETDKKPEEYFGNYIFNEVRLDIILKNINRRIEALLDREHTIGHSYFFEVYSATDKETALEDIFKHKIIPLLQEYFFGDYAKIGLVLGEEFIDIENITSNKIFANTDLFEAPEIGVSYKLKSFDEIDFGSALKSLMEYVED